MLLQVWFRFGSWFKFGSGLVHGVVQVWFMCGSGVVAWPNFDSIGSDSVQIWFQACAKLGLQTVQIWVGLGEPDVAGLVVQTWSTVGSYWVQMWVGLGRGLALDLVERYGSGSVYI